MLGGTCLYILHFSSHAPSRKKLTRGYEVIEIGDSPVFHVNEIIPVDDADTLY